MERIRKVFTGFLALLMVTVLCTSCSKKSSDDGNETKVEDESEIEIEESESSGGF